jgi:hypothetical protein
MLICRSCDLAIWEKIASELVRQGLKHVRMKPKILIFGQKISKSLSSGQMSAKMSEQEALVTSLFSVSLQP